MPKISVCMIVKNEEKTLERCLESVKGFFDEIIVVDTGSTDKTKEIAKNYNTKLYDFEWVNDFSKARQFAKEKATGDWVLQIDADEYFEKGEAEKVKQWVEKTDKTGLSVKIDSFTVTHKSTRIFRNIPEITYKLKIHEQTMFKDDVLTDIEHTDITLFHTGYDKDTYKEKNKSKRNLTILKEEIKNNPNDGFTNFNIANEYVAIKDYKKALGHYQVAYKNGKGKTFESRSISRIIAILTELNRFEEAHNVIKDAKKIYRGYTDILFLEGQLLEKEGRIKEAVDSYELCLELGEANETYVTNKGVGTKLPLERLIAISMNNREFDEAMKYSMALLNHDKNNKQNVEGIVSLLRQTSTEEELVVFINKIYSNQTKDEIVSKLNVFQTFRLKEGVLEYYQNIIEDASIDLEWKFYAYFYTQNFNGMKETIEAMINERHESVSRVGFLYLINIDDVDVKEKLTSLNKTFGLVFLMLEGASSSKNKKYDKNLVLEILNELILIKDYEKFEKLMPIVEYFNNDLQREIGELFYKYHMDELAIQLFATYLSKNGNDTRILMKTAELLYASKAYEDAIEVSKKIISLRKNYFKPLEIIIESHKKLGEKEAVVSICEDLSKVYPESDYLSETIRSFM